MGNNREYFQDTSFDSSDLYDRIQGLGLSEEGLDHTILVVGDDSILVY